ncbi:hypothetical protein AtDm6_0850 [Acetobacter tropicalis]|uniref:Uncharacterized protein n=1 Tax=Acetobacter tropicalis TaxID=104102 RepID=A0A094YWY4_9PROT|nr:hypothetical protein AtDm6_0850 [Acetobacter tropicalis]
MPIVCQTQIIGYAVFGISSQTLLILQAIKAVLAEPVCLMTSEQFNE